MREPLFSANMQTTAFVLTILRRSSKSRAIVDSTKRTPSETCAKLHRVTSFNGYELPIYIFVIVDCSPFGGHEKQVAPKWGIADAFSFDTFLLARAAILVSKPLIRIG